MKKYFLLLVISISIFALSSFELKATGIGFYVPISFNSYSLGSSSPMGYGFGFTLDTRVAKNGLINYRLNLGMEYLSNTYESSYTSYYYPYNTYYSTVSSADLLLNLDNTLGFGIVRNKIMRLWVGPQVRLSPAFVNDVRDFAFGIGTAPVVGINFNFGKVMSLCFDMGYRYTYYLQVDNNYGDYSQYAFFMNFYLLFRLNDVYKR